MSIKRGFMKKIVFASSNLGKIKEVKKLLSDYEILSLSDIGFTKQIEETGSTFEENSFIKAKTVFNFCHIPTIADDSGLVVEALNGAPGVYSARYAGEVANDKLNRTLLLKNMQGVENRNAKFVTCATLVLSENEKIVTNGETLGRILDREVGENGFGYDSIFYSFDLNKSFGEASFEEKNLVSHRYRALKQLKEKLQ